MWVEEKQQNIKRNLKQLLGDLEGGVPSLKKNDKIEKIKFQQHARVGTTVKKDTAKEGRKINSGYQISGYQNYLSNQGQMFKSQTA